jgi:hypothetical protein
VQRDTVIDPPQCTLGDEFLDGEIFYTLHEPLSLSRAGAAIRNAMRPQGSIGYRAPPPEVFVLRRCFRYRPTCLPGLKMRGHLLAKEANGIEHLVVLRRADGTQ